MLTLVAAPPEVVFLIMPLVSVVATAPPEVVFLIIDVSAKADEPKMPATIASDTEIFFKVFIVIPQIDCLKDIRTAPYILDPV